MPAQRLSMRQVREVLRLKWACGLSDRKIAQSVRVSRPTVAEYVRRAQAAGLSWPLPDTLDDTALERRLFATAAPTPLARRPTPDWAIVHQELKRKGVTLLLLWQEYKASTPMASSTASSVKPIASGRGSSIWSCARATGRVRRSLSTTPARRCRSSMPSRGKSEAAIFIAVLGASNYTFAEATWSQSLPDWIGSHVRAFAALGGVPQVVVPDNLKAAVSRAHRYEPTLTRTYAELAQHYGVAIVPARPARPRDKAKVEVGVQVVERWILARLRHHTFFSLLELNTAIADLLVTLNRRPFKKLPGSRQSVFESLDRPALRPLPAQPYAYAEWKLVRVNIDYHVEVDGHYYSVPYSLVKQQLEVRLRAQVVEIFHRANGWPAIRAQPTRAVTAPWTLTCPRRTGTMSNGHPNGLFSGPRKRARPLPKWSKPSSPRGRTQQGFRACLGIMRLGKRYALAASKLPASAPSASVRVRIRVLNRFSNTTWIGSPCLVHPLPPRDHPWQYPWRAVLPQQ